MSITKDRVLEQTLANGLTVDTVDKEGRSVLHEAAAYGEIETIRFLLAGGAQVNLRDAQGRLPLHLAAERGNVLSVKVLVDAGADFETPDAGGRFPTCAPAALTCRSTASSTCPLVIFSPLIVTATAFGSAFGSGWAATGSCCPPAMRPSCSIHSSTSVGSGLRWTTFSRCAPSAR